MRIPFFSTSSPILAITFFILAMLMRIKWYLIAVMICISLMTNDVERFFLVLIG